MKIDKVCLSFSDASRQGSLEGLRSLQLVIGDSCVLDELEESTIKTMLYIADAVTTTSTTTATAFNSRPQLFNLTLEVKTTDCGKRVASVDAKFAPSMQLNLHGATLEFIKKFFGVKRISGRGESLPAGFFGGNGVKDEWEVMEEGGEERKSPPPSPSFENHSDFASSCDSEEEDQMMLFNDTSEQQRHLLS